MSIANFYRAGGQSILYRSDLPFQVFVFALQREFQLRTVSMEGPGGRIANANLVVATIGIAADRTPVVKETTQDRNAPCSPALP